MESMDHCITLAQATRCAPGKTHPSAVWRWCRNGIKTRRGDRIHLAHIRVGGRIFTKEEWLIRFFKDVANADVEYFTAREEATFSPSAVRPRSEQARLRAIERAEAELKAAGY